MPIRSVTTIGSMPPRSPVSRRVARKGLTPPGSHCRPSASPLPVSAYNVMNVSSTLLLPRQAPFLRGVCHRSVAYLKSIATPRPLLLLAAPSAICAQVGAQDWFAARSAPSRLFGQVLRALYRQCAVADNLTLSPGGVPSNTCSCNQSGGAAAHPSLAQEIRE